MAEESHKRKSIELKPFLQALEKLWRANPEWRFGQLAANICNAGFKEHGIHAKNDHFDTDDYVAKVGLEYLLEVEAKFEENEKERNKKE